MSEETVDPSEGVQLLRSYLLHCRHVRRGLARVQRALCERAECHDDSKLLADEFAGFSRINKAAREHPYGSEEYRAGLAREGSVIDLHYRRNSHHPEFHGDPLEGRCCLGVETPAQHMGFLDIIEMVCDWRGAYLAYGSQGTWDDGLAVQRKRYADWFTEEQWWLIEQVAAFVIEPTP